MPNTNTKQKNREEKVIVEKDDAERKLESLLFGGDDFHSALKTGQDGNALALANLSDESADEAGENEEEEDLENIDDADVCIETPLCETQLAKIDLIALLSRLRSWTGVHRAR
jgi:U3 small nucleolar RNA-associated protein 18